MLGLRLGLGLRGIAPSVPAPTLASLNYAQADVLGGGSDIVATGTNLTGATALTVGGTSATITGNTATTVTFTPPAKTAGTYDVVVTTPGGIATLAASYEAWAPTTDAAVTALDEAPDYNATTGAWTSRFGSVSAAWKDAKVPAVNGAPNFDGTGCLDSATAFTTYVPVTGGGVAVVTTATNTDAMTTATPYNNPTIVCPGSPGGQGTLGLTAGQLSSVQGYMFHVWDSSGYRTAFVAAAVGGPRTVIGQFAVGSLTLTVDGTTVAAATPPAANWGLSTGIVRYGGKYLLTASIVKLFRGTTRAVCLFSGAPGASFNTKFRKWAQQRHGAA